VFGRDFEIRNLEVESKLNEIGHLIGPVLPKGFGFTLLIFSFGPGGSMFYISNSDRRDMIKAMKEFIAKQEGHA
jgi:hypothetical protein